MYNGSYFYFSFFVCGLGPRKRILNYPFPICCHEIEKGKDGIYSDRAVHTLIIASVVSIQHIATKLGIPIEQVLFITFFYCLNNDSIPICVKKV